MSYKPEELKLAYNTRSGQTRQLGPNIYNNPFRMKAGHWKLCEMPPEFKGSAPVTPVSVNVPTGQVETATSTLLVDSEQPENLESTSTEIPDYKIPEEVEEPVQAEPPAPAPVTKSHVKPKSKPKK